MSVFCFVFFLFFFCFFLIPSFRENGSRFSPRPEEMRSRAMAHSKALTIPRRRSSFDFRFSPLVARARAKTDFSAKISYLEYLNNYRDLRGWGVTHSNALTILRSTGKKEFSKLPSLKRKMRKIVFHHNHDFIWKSENLKIENLKIEKSENR